MAHRQKNGPKTVADLSGKRVARQQASFQDRYLQGLLDAGGPEGKVQLTAMLNPQAIAALQKGALDAAAIAVVQSKGLADQGFPVLDKSDDHPELQGTSVTTVSDSFAEKHPDIAQAFVDAHFKALDLAKSEEDPYYAYQATATGAPEDVVRAWDPLSSYPDEPFTPAGTKQLQGTLDFLVDAEAGEAVHARGLGRRELSRAASSSSSAAVSRPVPQPGVRRLLAAT